MRKFLVDSTSKKEKKCLPLFSSPLQPSVHINLMGHGDGRVLCLKASRLLPPRGIGSDLILPANVVRGRLHLPQRSSGLLIGPSELIKR